mmetsp:Transcript_1344/g.1795  ORF Transcript_1344/g.1795 Transcript_1344/m.1795 type:complete len:188 (-) Transcript_1344:575-1138(-)
MWRFGDCAIRVETTTNVEGIPAADCFHVADRWIIERTVDGGVDLSVHVNIVFTKRTMFKGLIEKSTKKEIQRWYGAYLDMLKREVANLSMLESGSRRDEVKSVVPKTVEPNENAVRPPEIPNDYLSRFYTVSLLACCGLLLLLILFQSWHTQSMMVKLQQDIVLLQKEQTELMAVMAQQLKRRTDEL